MTTLLAPPRTSFTPPRGVPGFPRREAEREAGATVFRETSEPSFMRDLREKVAAAERSVKAGRVMDGFESLKTVRMKHGL